MNQEFNHIMERIKNLQEFEVVVDVPEDFQFYGVVPFDMSISGGKAFVRMVAASMEEAIEKANTYFKGPPEEEM